MRLPVMPPVKPMLAKSAPTLPEQDAVAGGISYEPKWDGFRAIIFRDGDEVEIGSRNERPLTRYFPEVADTARRALPERCVVDGEIIISTDGRLDFEALQLRLHPAESRVRKLAAETPAQFVAFDLLALGDDSLLATAYLDRRAALERIVGDDPSLHLTPVTTDTELARRWFTEFEGAGLDGIVAKPHTLTYRPDQRVMTKVKHARTADSVVAGFRWHKSGPVVGSLLLGLYDDDGELHHIGVSASFTTARRRELVDELEPFRDGTEDHPWLRWHELGPGAAASRWNAGKDLSFVPLRPELVVEVGYDYMEGSRLRHTGQFKRWRPDREPRSCTFSQLERPLTYPVDAVWGS